MISSRRKSCINCVKAKRRCDLGLPACRRCATRPSKCVYPWAETYQQSASMLDTSTFELEIEDDTPSDRNISDLQALSEPQLLSENGVSAPATIPPVLQPLSPGMSSLIDEVFQSGGTSLFSLEPGISAGTPGTVQQMLPATELDLNSGPITTGSVFQERSEYAARRLRLQPRTLVDTGQTAFIHSTQVAASTALQEALAASALHAMKSGTNMQLLNSEIDRRAAILIATVESDMSSQPAAEIDLLAPAQALLIYQCIRLFSSNIRQQAQAERDERYLLSWVGRLREQLRPFGFSDDWCGWVREESVRRTVLTAEVVCGTYAFLKQGWDSSEAGVMSLGFTAQAALWEALSAAEWRAAFSRGPKIEVTMKNWDRDMIPATPDSAEELGIIIRAMYSGLEPLEEWLKWDKPSLLKWGLRS